MKVYLLFECDINYRENDVLSVHSTYEKAVERQKELMDSKYGREFNIWSPFFILEKELDPEPEAS